MINQENLNEETVNDSIQVSILASGSSGNCTYIETKGQKVLIDAGLSGKRIEQLLSQIGRQASDLDAIFVTHEHKDHIHGVGVLSRRYQLPIYANKQTWRAMEGMLGKIDPENKRFFEMEEMLSLGDLDILSYPVSHDATNPQFYAFQKGDKQFVLLTDTGYVSDRLRSMLHNADGYLIESNHEIEMLRYGPYPWALKQRILSDLGHLSNEDGALAMVDLIGDSTKHIYLGHLSRDNNTQDLAMNAMCDILTSYDLGVSEAFDVHLTYPDQPTKLLRL